MSHFFASLQISANLSVKLFLFKSLSISDLSLTPKLWVGIPLPTLYFPLSRRPKAERRWAVTGTPMQNGLGDLWALLRFLRHEPWCEPAWWREAVARPHARGDPRALARLRLVLQPLLLRRTKATRGGDGEPIVALPPRTVHTVEIDLSDAEREFYDALLAR